MAAAVSKSDPDPTTATTAQLMREMEHQRELSDTRFDGMDKAIALLQSNADKSPTIAVVDEKLAGQKSVFMEMFSSIQTQFNERDTRTTESAKTIETAINAALQSAEKLSNKANENFAQSIDKSEKSVTKEIDAVKSRIDQNTKSTDDKIAALDKRLTEINGHSAGLSDGWGYVVGAIGVVVAIGTFAVLLIGKTP